MSDIIAPRNDANFAFSDARRSAIERAKASTASGIAPNNQAVHDRITYMGLWDKFLDWAVRDGLKQKALALIADKIFLDQATENDPALAKQLEMRRRDTDLKLIGLLSPRGEASFFASHEITDAGVLFRPDTGHPEIDEVLCVTVSADKAGQAICSAQGPDAAATAFHDWANNSDKPEQSAELFAHEARAWEAARACAGKRTTDACAGKLPKDYDQKIMSAWTRCASTFDLSATLRNNITVGLLDTNAELAVEGFRASAEATKSAAVAWQSAASVAGAIKRDALVSNYQKQADASVQKTAKYTHGVARAYRSWALQSTDPVLRPELFRQEAIAWTEIGAHKSATEAWLGCAVTSSGRSAVALMGIDVAGPDDAGKQYADSAKWAFDAAVAYGHAATSAVRIGDNDLTVASRRSAHKEQEHANSLLAAARKGIQTAARASRRMV